MTSRVILLSFSLGFFTGCASTPVPDVRRTALAAPDDVIYSTAQTSAMQKVEPPSTAPQPQIRRGNGHMINRSAASPPVPSLRRARSGSATFNFEGESVHEVVKAILGDMLGQNYVLAPGVQGTVTLGTPKPVSQAEALNLLEMVLGWNNARLVYSGGRYNIIPADQALAGSVAPRTGPASNARGYEVRVVPLRFISASEMKKLLEPYALPNAIVHVDATRNVIALAGTRTELENYLRTVEIFDVDWLSGMSVGVFPLRTGRATRVVTDLEKVFGNDSKTPSAGMFRFMSLEGANAVLVITPQAAYLDQIQQWLARIDGAGAGAGSRLFSYELKYVKALELAQRLADVFRAIGSSASSMERSSDGDSNVSLMPRAESGQIGGMNSNISPSDYRSGSSSNSGNSAGLLSFNQRDNGNSVVTLDVAGARVGVTAVEETNTLLVRASTSAWQSIFEVIERLDVMPLQVHIEAQIAEVSLTGDLSYGVNWYLEHAITDNGLQPFAEPGAGGPSRWSALAGSIGGVSGAGPVWTLAKNDVAAVISALEEVSDVRLLQTPSIFVRNNAEATLNVGSRIPISSVTVAPRSGTDNSYSQVQYLDTGVILNVRPRVTKNGVVFLDIAQEVSSPGSIPDANGNVRINTRKLQTQVAVHAGETVMLAGLISDGTTTGSSGIPGLSRIPLLGGFFGRKNRSNDRSEVLVLITPSIALDLKDVSRITDEYGQKFKALEPLR
jgi:general secretion pathway protein D